MDKRIWTTKFARTVIGIIGVLGVGCGGGDEHPAPAGTGTTVVTPVPSGELHPVRTGPCATEGQTETCDVPTGRVGNIVNCFRGTQRCSDGAWSQCGEPSAGD